MNYINDMLYYVGGCLLLTVSVCLCFFDVYCVEVLPLLGVNDAVLLIFC